MECCKWQVVLDDGTSLLSEAYFACALGHQLIFKIKVSRIWKSYIV